ncbi:4'-phosphopantetheinyl transferase superfamily protein [Pseudophaeobacter sp.]|uniref:4'-phosphopantetheinyl transferase family protein n=1 Tax=Pseudophaeobacter sp. TaxID=1971739 RepID=UPI003297A1AA
MTAETSTLERERLTQVRHSLVRPLFGDDIALAVSNPLGNPAAPLAEEVACLTPTAVPKRRNEFAAGRAAAHQAMRQLGLPVQAIPVGENRAPVWPQGIVGSITHTRSCAMAVLAHQGEVRALGIDVEEDKPLATDLWPAICSDREQDWLRAQGDPGQMAKLIFSAKEAAYKCQYTLSERFYGFEGMELTVDTAERRFSARFCADQPPFAAGECIGGRFAIGAGLIVTTAELRS